MTLQARLLYRGDPRKPYLPVDTLAGTAEFRLGRVAETVQGEIVPVSYTHLDVYKRQESVTLKAVNLPVSRNKVL